MLPLTAATAVPFSGTCPLTRSHRVHRDLSTPILTGPRSRGLRHNQAVYGKLPTDTQ